MSSFSPLKYKVSMEMLYNTFFIKGNKVYVPMVINMLNRAEKN